MPHKTKRFQVIEFAVKKWKIIIKNLNVKIVKNLFILHVWRIMMNAPVVNTLLKLKLIKNHLDVKKI